ncbi:MAG: hypothetical protein JNM63_00175 [Spirochaetia bacterium]|nr:hypothetical protein [Spirochaetia bacterium]
MKILLSLNPKLHISGDRVATEEWMRQCHAVVQKKEKCPSTRWGLEEWEDFDEKNSSFFKEAVNVFTSEVNQIYLAFLAIAELSASRIEAWRIFDQVIQENQFEGAFEGHAIMGQLTPGSPAGQRPGTTRIDLIHTMPDGKPQRHPMYLEKIEAAQLMPQGSDIQTLHVSDLSPKVVAREAIPSYLHAAISGVHGKKWKWKQIQQPISLGADEVHPV